MRSKLNLFFCIIRICLLLSTLLSTRIIKEFFSLFEGCLVVSILARELLSKYGADFVYTDHRVEYLRLLDQEDVVQLLQSLVGRKRLGLNFILVRFFVQGQAIASDRRVDCRAEVSILLDDITALGINFDAFASFVHLTQDFDSLALDLSQRTLLILCFLQPDFFCALGVLFLQVTLSLNKGRLE